MMKVIRGVLPLLAWANVLTGCGAMKPATTPLAQMPEGNQGATRAAEVVPETSAVYRRIRSELESGSPDNTPSVDTLSVNRQVPGYFYTFRAQVTVIGIAGPSRPLRSLVEGTYDARSGQLTVTRRTPL